MGSDSVFLVTGAGGQVGSALRKEIPNGRFLSHSQFDVTDRSQLRGALSGCSGVIHLAAMTHVDRCEEEPQRAAAVNGAATGALAEAAALKRIPLIYLSTDYVFDGSKAGSYSETDTPNPINTYGRTKLVGERYVAEHENNLIVRTSWVFGEGRNFIRTILEVAKQGQAIPVVDDQVGRPTSAVDLAAALTFAAHSGLNGLIHVSGTGPACTWADLAERALLLAGTDVPIKRVDTKTYARLVGKTIAARPKNSVLLLERAEGLGVPLGEWQNSLRTYLSASR